MNKNFKKKGKDTLIEFGGGMAGVYGGNAVKALIPGQTDTIGNAVVTLGGAGMKLFINGDKWYHDFLQAMGVGMMLNGGYGLVNGLVAPKLPPNDGTKKNKFVHKLFATGVEPTTTTTKRMLGTPGNGYRFHRQNRLQRATTSTYPSGGGMQMGMPTPGQVQIVH